MKRSSIFRRADHFDLEGARGRRLGGGSGPTPRRGGELDLPLEGQVRRYGGFRGEAAARTGGRRTASSSACWAKPNWTRPH